MAVRLEQASPERASWQPAARPSVWRAVPRSMARAASEQPEARLAGVMAWLQASLEPREALPAAAMLSAATAGPSGVWLVVAEWSPEALAPWVAHEAAVPRAGLMWLLEHRVRLSAVPSACPCRRSPSKALPARTGPARIAPVRA
ncbi:hypothetical protein [Nitrobacter sp.]|uniref:hypothetical protein n=1 Tax=Nitrobacter sp. TaxID=29420 RepID=UPI00321FF46F